MVEEVVVEEVVVEKAMEEKLKRKKDEEISGLNILILISKHILNVFCVP